MADGVNNCFLVNAPAGSGKTTYIKAMVSKLTLENPKDNILCLRVKKPIQNPGEVV